MKTTIILIITLILTLGSLSCGVNNPPPDADIAPYVITYEDKDYAVVSYHILDNGAIVLETYYTFSGLHDGWKYYDHPLIIQGSYTVEER